jgi:hypothetical protein
MARVTVVADIQEAARHVDDPDGLSAHSRDARRGSALWLGS